MTAPTKCPLCGQVGVPPNCTGCDTAAAEVAGQDLRAEIERLRAALVLFIQTVNPPYPQSMALWQEHLKAATENAKAALTAAAEAGEPVDKYYVMSIDRRNSIIDHCAQAVKDWFTVAPRYRTKKNLLAVIDALKDRP